MIRRSFEELVSMIDDNGLTVSVRLPESPLYVQGVSIDSRTVKQGQLFIPIVRVDDGHNYVSQAFENGAVASLWQADHVPYPEGLPLIIVKDTLEALQKLAQSYRKQLSCKVVGITGSNGKTTVKDLAASILSTAFKVQKTHGNLNGEYGLPLSLLDVEEDTEIIVLEMGMSQAGEMRILSDIAKPDVAVITMIGVSHLSQLGSREGIAAAKLEIIEGLSPAGAIIINGDEPLLTQGIARMELTETLSVLRFGEAQANDYYPLTIEQSETGLAFISNRYSDEIAVSLLGKHNALNVLAAIAVADQFGLSEQAVRAGLHQIEMTGMRMERIPAAKGFLIINDAWNASPVSMKAAIETVAGMDGFHRKMLVLGDMLELGEQENEYHEEIATCIDSSKIHTVYTIGQLSRIITDTLDSSAFDGEVRHFVSKDDLIAACIHLLAKDDAVLVKGSRGLKLEDVCIALSQ